MTRGRVAIVALVTVFCAGCGSGSNGQIVMGSKNFTEQVILGELLAEHIEARTGLKVERRFNLGGTFICQDAIRSGQIDLYAEYTGTALTAILHDPPLNDPLAVYGAVKREYARRFGLDVMPPLGFNNSFAMVVRGADARRLKLQTISDIRPYAARWRAGFGYEFMERPDGYPGFVKAYGLRFAPPPRIMELGLIYRALLEKQVDIVAGNTTDGAIEAHDLVILKDDRHYFPPYDAVPIVREQTLERYPRLRAALDDLAGKISEQDMRRMNYAVDGQHRDVKQVVAQFLRSKGL
jgi:osmoprotectant transport system substrate-binding protein